MPSPSAVCQGGRAVARSLVAGRKFWSHGAGPEIIGPAEGVLMAVAGRQSAVGELTGPGQPILASRLAR
jgi:hypothetical protein